MTKGTFRIGALMLALLVLGFVVWSAGAAGEGGIIQRLHGCDGPGGQGEPGFGHSIQHIHELIEDLELNAEQQEHIAAIHQTLMGKVSSLPEVHTQHLHKSLERLEAGYTDTFELRQDIDQHIKALRQTAYSLADEWAALSNSLDGNQREVLRHHLESALAATQESGDAGSWLSRLGQRIHRHHDVDQGAAHHDAAQSGTEG